MTRSIRIVLVASLIALVCAPAEAARRNVQVPDRYDGSWTITAVTTDGPCAASTSYQVRIKDSDASIPGDDIDIDGGVSVSGSVRATITSGSHTVPISGSLDPSGNGAGTWRASGGLVACSGSWSAKRAG